MGMRLASNKALDIDNMMLRQENERLKLQLALFADNK
jgi:hypothetical protein